MACNSTFQPQSFQEIGKEWNQKQENDPVNKTNNQNKKNQPRAPLFTPAPK